MSARTPIFDPQGDLSGRTGLLEASAGTGKTHSITTLFLRLVCEPEWTAAAPGGEPVEAGQILVVTFTEAATAEMRERIRSRLRTAREGFERALHDPAWAPEGDDVLAFLVRKAREAGALRQYDLRVERALAGFDEVSISTIHGFCQRMLLRNAFESGTEFDAELVPDLSPLVEEAVTDFVVRETHDLPADLLALFEGGNLGGLPGLRRLARTVLGAPDTAIVPDDVPPFDPAAWEAWKEALAFVGRTWAGARDAVVDALVRAAEAGVLKQTSYKPSQILAKADAIDVLVEALADGAIDPFASDLDALACFGRDRILANVKAKAAAPDLPGWCDDAATAVAAVPQGQACAHAFLTGVRARFLDEVRRTVERRKREGHVQGFDDLLRRLRDGLATGSERDALRRAIADQYRVAVIDEFQDTDPVQWSIFETVFGRDEAPGEGRGGPRMLRLVGDPKQAIYGFRQADVRTYLAARSMPGMRRERLGTNWRSDAPLVRAVNAVFGRPDLPDAFLEPDIPYEDVTASHDEVRFRRSAGRAADAPLRIAFVGRGDRPGLATKEEARDRIFPFVAADIRAFLDGGNEVLDPDTKSWRAVHPGDVAVLVRSHFQGRGIERALRRLGIPCVRRAQEGVFEGGEAAELVRVLKAVRAPGDRVVVRSGLATSLLGVQARPLADLETDDLQADAWRARLEGFCATWERDGFMRMFREILADRDVVPRALAQIGGERSVTNLLHLAELVHDAARRDGLRPEGQLAWLEAQAAGQGGAAAGDADARLVRLESDARAVRIVTIHASKGLQYPFVWCPFLWDGQLLHSGDFPRFHRPDGGLALDVAPEGPGYAASRAAAELEALAEGVRLAYVALTRARHACTLVTGAIRSLADSALGFLLHEGQAVPAGTPVADRWQRLKDRVKSAADADLCADLDRVAAASTDAAGDAALRWFPIEAGAPAQVWRPPADDAGPIEPEPFAPWRALDPAWHWSSFSGMTARGAPGDEGGEAGEAVDGTGMHRDHDGRADDAAGPSPADAAPSNANDPAPPDAPPTPVPLDDFPRGRDAGEFLHRIFEVLDFQADDASLRATVREQRDHFGVAVPDVDRLADGIRAVLDTPLGLPGTPEAALRLRDVPRVDTLRELDFVLPARGGYAASRSSGVVSPASLAAAFRGWPGGAVPDAYAERVASLGFGGFRGFLNGSIDLVFRWRAPGADEARWYVVDYKSNRLPHGQRDAGRYVDYAPGALGREMAHAHYVLQYHLYLVALHRYLRWRVPGYDGGRHLGGVFYLFLRGMQGASPSGDSGVFRDRPPCARIEALSRVFEGPGPSAVSGEVAE